MNSRFLFLAWLAVVTFSFPLSASADSGAISAGMSAVEVSVPVLQPCPPSGDRLNLAEISQTECCKGHKGICGCRAGKIVCCDGTVSPNCTCHGEDGFME